jgi:hypothetical protein
MKLHNVGRGSFGLAAAIIAFGNGAQAQTVAQQPSSQQQPAVSGLNGKFSLEGGAVGSGGAGGSALGIAQGSISVPLGHSFGLQIDGLAAQARNIFLGGGAAHLFWRDPQLGLVGPIVALGGGAGGSLGWFGGEAELYKGIFTLRALAGYQRARSPFGSAKDGGFWRTQLSVYPIDDLAVGVGVGRSAGFSTGRATVEWQPDFIDSHNVSLFVDSAAGDDSYWRVTSGVRFYFGAGKTLIRRHREDDPSSAAEFDCEMKINGFQPESLRDRLSWDYQNQVVAN